MDGDLRDSEIRRRAFTLLTSLSARHGDVLPFKLLSEGFEFEGVRVPLLGPQGIFKPSVMDLPLSITTAPTRPYNDAFTADGFLRYRYRGTDPMHRDNIGLRRVMEKRLPILYLHGISKGSYLAAWPVYIVKDDPADLCFTVAVDHSQALASPLRVQEEGQEYLRQYGTALVRRRLHQQIFRERVLHAYQGQCALCRLRHVTLLDAAHIIPDADPGGEPRVSNGLSLCKLHHAAFDQNILGIRPDYVAEIRFDILEEVDGPMLRHGLQEMHGMSILVPRAANSRPARDALEHRYEMFLGSA